MFKDVVGDETGGYPAPVRSGVVASGGLQVEQDRPEFEGYQKNPSNDQWHYIRAGESASVCGLWQRSRSQRVDNRQPVLGMCDMCLAAMEAGDAV